MFDVFVTVTENCWVWPPVKVADDGLTLTPTVGVRKTPITSTSARWRKLVPLSWIRRYRPCAPTVMVLDGLGKEVRWVLQVPALYWSAAGVSLGPNGVSERKTQ